MKNLIVLLLCFGICGCATPYQKIGFTGGYTDTKIQDDVFKVTFKGNAKLERDRAEDYGLLRCAEVTLENNYNYFVVVDAKSDSKRGAFTTPQSSYSSGSVNVHSYGNYASGSYSGNTQYYGGQTFMYDKPRVTFTIKCYKEKPELENVFVYDAEQVKTNVKKAYNIK